jgi:hypothetical protein
LDDPDHTQGENETGDSEAGGESETPPPVHASPPPSVRRGNTPPPAAGKIQEDPEELPPERRDAAPPVAAASGKPDLGDAIKRGVRAVQDAVGDGDLPPPRRSRGEG